MVQLKPILLNKYKQLYGNIATELKNDKNISDTDQLTKLDVILDTYKFLERYDENTRALNEYWYNKKFNIENERDER